MPISDSEAAKVIERLAAMPGFPRTEEGVSATLELVTNKLTSSPVHINAFVSEILEQFDSMPSPRALIELARKTEPEKSRQFGCSKCDYTGFIETTMTLGERTAPASAPCDCRLHPEPDPDEWHPRVNDEGVSGPVAAQRAITRAWADETVEKMNAAVKSL